MCYVKVNAARRGRRSGNWIDLAWAWFLARVVKRGSGSDADG